MALAWVLKRSNYMASKSESICLHLQHFPPLSHSLRNSLEGRLFRINNISFTLEKRKLKVTPLPPPLFIRFLSHFSAVVTIFYFILIFDTDHLVTRWNHDCSKPYKHTRSHIQLHLHKEYLIISDLNPVPPDHLAY